MTSASVSALSLGKKIIETLGITNGETFDLSKLRDGSVLLRKAGMRCKERCGESDVESPGNPT